MRHQLYEERLRATSSVAREQVNTMLGATDGGSVGGPWGAPYEIVADDGELLTSSPELAPFERGGRAFLPGPGRGGSMPLYTERRFRFPVVTDPAAHALSGRTLTTVDGTVPATAMRGQTQGHTLAADARARVYILIVPDDAEQAVASLDHQLMAGVPTATLLVACVAWLATRRALRPVEAIRARTASVTATDPRERVEVPDTGDEVQELALTINATLERLDEAARAQRRFVADAAHELRSPLATLLAGLEVASAYPDRADWPSVVAAASRQSRRLSDLTEELLLLARLDAGAPAPPSEPVDLAALAGLLAEEYAERAGASPKVDLFVDAPGATSVFAAPGDLERIVRNLLDNAVRHADGHVLLTVAQDTARPPSVLCTVRDDGPGVPASESERIFERFTRLDESRARVGGGTGLGLAIARDLAVRHGGWIDLAIQPTGSGACFVLRLPLTDTTIARRPDVHRTGAAGPS
ncbi:sensor histidine kinase [Streptomyces sp. NPDC019531]|uniref:sensor histidine kinase n=1 Tax=Streptomyces sp. NPDC019531 TaxID=3365062 RepID=UPI00384F25D2